MTCMENQSRKNATLATVSCTKARANLISWCAMCKIIATMISYLLLVALACFGALLVLSLVLVVIGA